MPETQHHSIDFVLTATATTPAAAIQGTKAGQSPASNAPGLTKALSSYFVAPQEEHLYPVVTVSSHESRTCTCSS